ncbi:MULTISPECIES: CamS family sex pheromone protein [Bacillaceae]|uniref:CamS family sex pheromone protein n=1 Tax=Sutcliffiella horikoshii TaxID=79883 RepID=A0A5D4T0R6_9BACI|nr:MULTISPECIES: CamS family sex pheromone protein [Bacillaceae]TYS69257.1 CamS family sex pheromone protein [Sutcliffiella horikoshii]
MKRFLSLLLVVSLFATGCVPGFEKQEEVVQDPAQQENTEQAIVPRYKISDDYYQTILPYKPGETRGQIAPRLNSRVDVEELETGLMRMAQDVFPSDSYLYQEGQYIKRDTIRSWLGRVDPEDEEKPGLNPPLIRGVDTEDTNEKSPIYLAHIQEQNYLVRKGEDQVELGGVSIGIALNSVHYYNLTDEEGGYPREYVIPDDELEAEGKKIAEEVIRRVRGMEGLENVPIIIGLYKQSPANAVVPGSFIAKANVATGNNTVSKWEEVNEEYHLFPNSDTTELYRDDAVRFENFKLDIDDYFPNHTGVIGKGYYRDGELQQLSIEVNMEFNGKAELIGFTQYVTGLVVEHFPNYINLQVSISSISGEEALIVRDAGSEKPFVHIY